MFGEQDEWPGEFHGSPQSSLFIMLTQIVLGGTMHQL